MNFEFMIYVEGKVKEKHQMGKCPVIGFQTQNILMNDANNNMFFSVCKYIQVFIS